MNHYLVEVFSNGQLIDTASFPHRDMCYAWVEDKWGYLIGEKPTRTFKITEINPTKTCDRCGAKFTPHHEGQGIRICDECNALLEAQYPTKLPCPHYEGRGSCREKS